MEIPKGVVDQKRWDQVSSGDTVEVCLDGIPIERGDVELASENGDVVWVVVSLGERRLFHKDDGLELFCTSK
ncbi:hypothetical protein [Pseudarthrobacter sp. fls2-241-R2A-168]|uniref:hypothetical protein n=1 Tax=Pseudarthrobacter sp. fls2-241-R2A-168 TaxID=3040304 RepID=UPI0025536416|nr:hypothetical protein [Pseudarthrobacter sp. fls2-241-R2A-168]